MPRILEGREPPRQSPGRAVIVLRRDRLVQAFVRPVPVVLGAEAGEAALLCGGTRRRGPRRLRFEHLMKLLMRAVLLRMSRIDALGHDAQANPPDGERRQAPEAGPAKGRPVVTPNPIRQAVLGKGPLESRLRHRAGVRRQRIAPQHIPTKSVAQRERVAVAAIAGEKLAFVIDRPHLIGLRDHATWRPRRCRRGVPPPARRDQAAPLQQGGDRRSRRPRLRVVAALGDGQQLLRPPTRMPATNGEDRLDHLRVGRVRTVMWPSRSILQARQAACLVCHDPLVARFAADAVLRSQLGHREQAALELPNKIRTLLHRRHLAPRHRGTSARYLGAAAEKCYLCRWTELLPMYAGFTGAPSPIFCRFDTMTRCPDCRPPLTT